MPLSFALIPFVANPNGAKTFNTGPVSFDSPIFLTAHHRLPLAFDAISFTLGPVFQPNFIGSDYPITLVGECGPDGSMPLLTLGIEAMNTVITFLADAFLYGANFKSNCTVKLPETTDISTNGFSCSRHDTGTAINALWGNDTVFSILLPLDPDSLKRLLVKWHCVLHTIHDHNRLCGHKKS